MELKVIFVYASYINIFQGFHNLAYTNWLISILSLKTSWKFLGSMSCIICLAYPYIPPLEYLSCTLPHLLALELPKATRCVLCAGQGQQAGRAPPDPSLPTHLTLWISSHGPSQLRVLGYSPLHLRPGECGILSQSAPLHWPRTHGHHVVQKVPRF